MPDRHKAATAPQPVSPLAHNPHRAMPIAIVEIFDVDTGRLPHPQPEKTKQAEQSVIHRPRRLRHTDTTTNFHPI
jgi:hypothetical protein